MNPIKNEVYEQLIQVSQMLAKQQMQNNHHAGPFHNPRRGQGRVLSILKLKEEITQKELSYLLDMRKQSLAELLSKLEKNGYILREPSKEDRRVLNIKLTDAGKKAMEGINDEIPSTMNILDCLSDEETTQFGDYLERIMTHAHQTLWSEKTYIDRKKAMEDFIHQHGGRMNRRDFRSDVRNQGFAGRPNPFSHMDEDAFGFHQDEDEEDL